MRLTLEEMTMLTDLPKDVYRDSHERYRNDAEFRAAVDCVLTLAVQNGYTPGELRQIAFMAALKAEEHSRNLQTRTYPLKSH